MEADTYEELYTVIVANGLCPDDYEAYVYANGNKTRLVARPIETRTSDTWSVQDALNWFNE